MRFLDLVDISTFLNQRHSQFFSTFSFFLEFCNIYRLCRFSDYVRWNRFSGMSRFSRFCDILDSLLWIFLLRFLKLWVDIWDSKMPKNSGFALKYFLWIFRYFQNKVKILNFFYLFHDFNCRDLHRKNRNKGIFRFLQRLAPNPIRLKTNGSKIKSVAK